MALRRDYSWLPDHQLHVATTLAHTDDLMQTMSDVLLAYLEPNPGPLELSTVLRGDMADVVITGVRPLPAAVASYASDALTALRAAVEHTIYAEVEYLLGRPLVGRERRMIEMPASTRWEDFSTWLGHKDRKRIAPFRDREFVSRIDQLQPYQRRDPDEHPLRVLATHTNFSKHRAPAVTTTRLGAVIPDEQHDNLSAPSKIDGGHLIAAGDVIASGPAHLQVPLSIWPQVSIQRPHTGTWHVLMHELSDLERWVRTRAIPILVTGASENLDHLPPQLNTRVGYVNVRAELSSAGTVSAKERAGQLIAAHVARDGIINILTLHSKAPDGEILEAWVKKLTGEEILERWERLGAAMRNPLLVDCLVVQWIAEAVAPTHAKGQDR